LSNCLSVQAIIRSSYLPRSTPRSASRSASSRYSWSVYGPTGSVSSGATGA
jgi:hypothetical protein